MNPITILARAFNSNIPTIKPSAEELADLDAHGIADPTIQRYVVWRKATILLVIIATLLSATLTTVNTLTESDEQPDFMETLSQTVLKKIEAAVPAAANLGLSSGDLPATAAGVLPIPPPTASTSSAEKADAEEKAGPTDSSEKKDDESEDDDKPLLGKVVDGMHLIALYAMPIAAIVVLKLGYNFRTAYRVLVAAFLFSFFAPMLIELLPWSLWETPKPPTNPAEAVKDQAEGVMEGIAVMLQLLPAVLSLIPGVQKACLRVKTLLPQSSLPGWFIVVASPLYGLFLFVVFLGVDQITSQPAILASLGLLSLASLFYVFRPGIFTQPLLTDADYQRMRRTQLVVTLITALAGLILVVYLTTSEFMGIHLVGFDPQKALMSPMDIVEFGLEIIARSMFVGVLGAELMMRLSVTAWTQNRLVAASEAAEPYDQAMAQMQAIS